MAPTTGDRTRQWLLADRILLVAFMLALTTLSMAGVELWLVFAVTVVPFLASSWLTNPRRPWWGTAPMAITNDPERLKNVRRAEVRFGIFAFVLIVLIPIILSLAVTLLEALTSPA